MIGVLLALLLQAAPEVYNPEYPADHEHEWKYLGVRNDVYTTWIDRAAKGQVEYNDKVYQIALIRVVSRADGWPQTLDSLLAVDCNSPRKTATMTITYYIPDRPPMVVNEGPILAFNHYPPANDPVGLGILATVCDGK